MYKAGVNDWFSKICPQFSDLSQFFFRKFQTSICMNFSKTWFYLPWQEIELKIETCHKLAPYGFSQLPSFPRKLCSPLSFFSEKEDETSYHLSHGHHFGHRLPGRLWCRSSPSSRRKWPNDTARTEKVQKKRSKGSPWTVRTNESVHWRLDLPV